MTKLAPEQSRDRWNQFVVAQPTGSFLQSFEWGEFQAKMGVHIWRIEEADARALVVKRRLPFGKSWLYVPRGPVGHWGSELQKKLMEIGEKERAIFVRIDPTFTEATVDKARLIQGGWQKADREVQPRNTLVLDLDTSEEELLAGMHQKTRYNIRLAQKKGVTVRFSKEVRDVEHFLRLAHEVHGRGKFSYHPDEYYRTMVKVLAGGFTPTHISPSREGVSLELALAEYQGQVLAAHIIIYFGNTATYAHGASSSKLREVMAPHLLQWETIKRVKERGYTMYDFFGVAPEGSNSKHPWAGVTRFKLGFGGRRVDYIGTYDLVLRQGAYRLFTMARRLRGILRG